MAPKVPSLTLFFRSVQRRQCITTRSRMAADRAMMIAQRPISDLASCRPPNSGLAR
ncbi:hypothetical protein D3C80_2004100 [compost metagenome]